MNILYQGLSRLVLFTSTRTEHSFYTMAANQIKSDSKYDDFDYPTTSPEAKSGHPGHTTAEQDAQIYQLRTQLEQAGYTERLDTLSMVRPLCALI